MYGFNFGNQVGQVPISAQDLNFGTGVANPGFIDAAALRAMTTAPAVGSETGVGAPVAGAPAGATRGFFGKIGGLEGLGTIAKGLASLGGVYAALKGVGLARDQLDFSKRTYDTNLANSTKSYNTTLEDRARARFITEGRSDEELQKYLDKNRL